MAVILWIWMALMPFLLGNGVLRCLYGRKYKEGRTLGETYLAGFCVLLGSAEAAHLAAVLLRWTVWRAALLWVGIQGVLSVFSLITVCRAYGFPKGVGLHGGKRAEEVGTLGRLLTGVFLLSVLFQVILIMTGEGTFFGKDMTLETVRTFLAEDGAYSVNPMTGQPYTGGIPLRLKILCLPGMYAFLCRLTGLDAGFVVCRMVPVWILLVSYAAYGVAAGILFKKDRTGRILMLLAVSALYLFGGYGASADAILLLHCAFRGVSVRNGILVPFTLTACLEKKWRQAVLGILAEACIVWTLYGMGVCLLMTAVMALLSLLPRAGGRLAVRKAERLESRSAIGSWPANGEPTKK